MAGMNPETPVKVLLDNAARTEEQGRPAPSSLAAVREICGLALTTPAGAGGMDADTSMMARTLVELGRGCPSTAWIAGTCVTAKLLARRVLGEQARQELFADASALACGSAAPGGQGTAVHDGVRISGRWPNVSGCEDAEWAGLGVVIDGAFNLALIQTSQLTVQRTWSMAGMKGTGSHSLVAEDVLVPAHRIAPFGPPTGAVALTLAITVLAPVIGATQGALDVVRAMFASDRKPFMSRYSRMGESPGAQQWLAEAAFLTRRATSTMLDVARQIDTDAVTDAGHASYRVDLARAAADGRQAVDRMLDLHGASGFATSNPLQRFWRDAAVGSRHPFLNPYLSIEDYGAQLAGVAS